MSANGSAPDHYVRVRGARENNLRDIEVAIPRNALAQSVEGRLRVRRKSKTHPKS